MPAITSLESLDRAIQQVSGTPKVLEALWDGDTEGWYLCLSVYAEQGIWPMKWTVCHPLGSVTLGSDLRLFAGQVPPWPEAELVKTFVQQTQATYGLTLYLPSEEPDDECPRWPERAHARACADCGKLGLPSDSPYLPKDVCYRCHLRREQDTRIRNEAACDDGVHLYVYKDGVHRSLGYATHFDSFAIAPYVDPARLPGPAPSGVHVVTLEQEALVDIHTRLSAALDERLTSYEPAEKDARKSHFYHLEEINYQGVVYELEVKLHRLHRDISTLFHAWEGTRAAIADGASYRFYFKRGFTHRDDSVLRYLNYPTPSPKSIERVVQHYHGILTEEAVSRTLAKLEAMDCLAREGRDVTISQTGANIV